MPLEDRWHLLGTNSELPVTAVSAMPLLPDGSIGVRFRPGSHPRFQRFDFCHDEYGNLSVRATISELVRFDSGYPDLVSLEVDGAAKECRTSAEFTVRDCGRISPRATLTLNAYSVALGWRSDVRLEAGSWSIDPQLVRGSGCQTFVPPI